MAISIVCGHCGRKLRAKDEYQGRRVKCPACQHELVVTGERARPHDVFISYSTADKTTADAVCAALEAGGVRCWIAPRDILAGLDWSEGIIDAINDCRVMVLVFSSSSNHSQQVKREVERALAKEVPILPFRIEAVALSKSMEYFIGSQHWLDAVTPPLERNLERLTDTVRRLLAKQGEGSGELATPPLPAPALPPALPPAPAAEADAPRPAADRINRRPVFVAAGLVALLLVVALVLFWPRRASSLRTSPDRGGQSSEAGWRPLFNGRDLTGWAQFEVAGRGSAKPVSDRWSVKDGSIVCTGDTTSVLVAVGLYSDFELELEFQLPAEGLCGLLFRSPSDPKTRQKPAMIPLIHDAHFQELLQKSKAKADLFVLRSISDIARAVRPAGQWNSLELRCRGDQIQVALNGTQVVDASLTEVYGKVLASGTLALVNPDGMARGAAVRNLRVRELE